MASRILGMGTLTLIEKRSELSTKSLPNCAKMKANRLTLTDFYEQLTQLKNMGSLEDVMGDAGINSSSANATWMRRHWRARGYYSVDDPERER